MQGFGVSSCIVYKLLSQTPSNIQDTTHHPCQTNSESFIFRKGVVMVVTLLILTMCPVVDRP
jgi:hypothetical protein